MIPKMAQQWCVENNWTEPFITKGICYAFPPGAVIPLPVPVQMEQKKDIALLVVGISLFFNFVAGLFLICVAITLGFVRPWFLIIFIGAEIIPIFSLWICKISSR